MRIQNSLNIASVWLTLWCLCYVKLLHLERELRILVEILYSTYNDSIHDSPLLYFTKTIAE